MITLDFLAPIFFIVLVYFVWQIICIRDKQNEIVDRLKRIDKHVVPSTEVKESTKQ